MIQEAFDDKAELDLGLRTDNKTAASDRDEPYVGSDTSI